MSIDKAIESIKTTRLRGGIFGKTTLLLMVLTIGVCTVSFKSAFWWLTLALMLPLMGIVFYALKRSFDFASNNPHAAIMDGAELLQHERIVHASKDQGFFVPGPPTAESPLPQLIEATDLEQDAPPTEGDSAEDSR